MTFDFWPPESKQIIHTEL